MANVNYNIYTIRGLRNIAREREVYEDTQHLEKLS